MDWVLVVLAATEVYKRDYRFTKFMHIATRRVGLELLVKP